MSMKFSVLCLFFRFLLLMIGVELCEWGGGLKVRDG